MKVGYFVATVWIVSHHISWNNFSSREKNVTLIERPSRPKACSLTNGKIVCGWAWEMSWIESKKEFRVKSTNIFEKSVTFDQKNAKRLVDFVFFHHTCLVLLTSLICPQLSTFVSCLQARKYFIINSVTVGFPPNLSTNIFLFSKEFSNCKNANDMIIGIKWMIRLFCINNNSNLSLYHQICHPELKPVFCHSTFLFRIILNYHKSESAADSNECEFPLVRVTVQLKSGGGAPLLKLESSLKIPWMCWNPTNIKEQVGQI